LDKLNKKSQAQSEKADSRKEKRYQKTELVKEEILRSAIKLFVKQGFSQTTMTQIGRAVGMSKANLYNYIRSKDDFLFLILDKLEQEYNKLRDVVYALPPETAPVDRLREAISCYANIVNKYQDEYLVLLHGIIRLDREDREIFYKGSVRKKHIFTEIVRMGIAHGAFHSPYPELFVNNLTRAIDGWAIDRWHWHRTTLFEDFITQQTEFFLKQLSPPVY